MLGTEATGRASTELADFDLVAANERLQAKRKALGITTPTRTASPLPPLPQPDTPLGDAAVMYAMAGWAVFPLKPRDKPPIWCDQCGLHHGWKDASNDPARVARWWKHHPDANIGAATGLRSKRVVADIDPRNGGKLEDLPEVPETLRAVTGRGDGGVHLVFEYAPEVRSHTFSDGIDILSNGKYVVLPPSIHPDTGGIYRWENELRPLPAPRWLATRRERPGSTNATQDDPTYARRINGNHQHAADPIPKGKRRPTLVKIGGRLRAEGKDREAISAELLRINATQCTPKLEVDEVLHIVDSVVKYPAGDLPPISEAIPARRDLAELREIATRHRWRGAAGASQREVLLVMIEIAEQRGSRTLSISCRDAGQRAGMDFKVAYKALRALEDNGWHRRTCPRCGRSDGWHQGDAVVKPDRHGRPRRWPKPRVCRNPHQDNGDAVAHFMRRKHWRDGRDYHQAATYTLERPEDLRLTNATTMRTPDIHTQSAVNEEGSGTSVVVCAHQLGDDLWRRATGLGKSARVLVAGLAKANSPQSARALALAVGLDPRTAQKWLPRLHEHGLVLNKDGRWLLNREADVDAIRKRLRSYGRGARQRQQYEQARALFTQMCARWEATWARRKAAREAQHRAGRHGTRGAPERNGTGRLAMVAA